MPTKKCRHKTSCTK